MSRINDLSRILGASACGLASLFFLLSAALLPAQLREQARDDRAFYRQFQSAAAYAATYARDHNGALPSDDLLQSLGNGTDAESIWLSLTASGADCEQEFQHGPNDRFTLSFWRGDWSECFSYPSGATTLPMSESAYLKSGLGVEWAIWIGIGIACACAVFRLSRPRVS